MARQYSGRATPKTPEEYADALYNCGPDVSADFQRRFRDAYVEQMTADGSLDAQIREQTQLTAMEMLRTDRAGGAAAVKAIEHANRSSRRVALYNKNAPGARVDGIFESAHDLCASVSWRSRHDPAAASKLARAAEIQNSFGSEVPDAGGFLVPEHLRSDLLQMTLEQSLIRPRALVIPMDTLRVPIPMIDDISHATNVLGGVQFYWTEEAAAITESQATFGRVVLDARKLAGYFAVPNELLQDAPAFTSFFQKVVPAALSWFEDVAFMVGTGVGEPLGFVSCPASVTVAKQTGQLTNTVVWENIVGMYARMLPQSLNRACWIANIDTFPQLATMALAVGTGGGPVWIGNYSGGSGGADTPPLTLLGRPLYFTEKLPALSTTGDIIFTDLSFYLLGDRMRMELSSSEHFLFSSDKVAFRLLERVDGQPWLQSALTPRNDSSNTLSPFVQLATR